MEHGRRAQALGLEDFVVILCGTPSVLRFRVADMTRLAPNPKRAYVLCVCSVVCLSSVLHHVSGTNWEAVAGGTLSRWAYPESKLAMLLFAKVRAKKISYLSGTLLL